MALIDINTIRLLYLRRLQKFCSFNCVQFSNYTQLNAEPGETNGRITNEWASDINSYMLTKVENSIKELTKCKPIMIGYNEYIITYIEYEILLQVLHDYPSKSLAFKDFAIRLFSPLIRQITDTLDNQCWSAFEFQAFVTKEVDDQKSINELERLFTNLKSLNAKIDERVYKFVDDHVTSYTNKIKLAEIQSKKDIQFSKNMLLVNFLLILLIILLIIFFR